MGIKRTRARLTLFFDLAIITELMEQARIQKITVKELATDLVITALIQLKTGSKLKDSWESLTMREQEATALTCRGETNRQIAARLGVSPETVKTHVRNALVKFNLHGKSELRMALGKWDFSEWG